MPGHAQAGRAGRDTRPWPAGESGTEMPDLARVQAYVYTTYKAQDSRIQRCSLIYNWEKMDKIKWFRLDVMHEMDEGVAEHFCSLLFDKIPVETIRWTIINDAQGLKSNYRKTRNKGPGRSVFQAEKRRGCLKRRSFYSGWALNDSIRVCWLTSDLWRLAIKSKTVRFMLLSFRHIESQKRLQKTRSIRRYPIQNWTNCPYFRCQHAVVGCSNKTSGRLFRGSLFVSRGH